MAMRGVYAIVNRETSAWYIGSTCHSFRRRRMSHHNALRRDKHGNSSLSLAWKKCGEAAFEFSILEEMMTQSEDEIREHEQTWLDMARMDGRPIYNARMSMQATNAMTGAIHTLAAREKMSRARRGRKLTEEWKQKIRVSSFGIKKPGTAKALAKSYPAFKHRETGEIIPPGYNLTALCRKRGLASTSQMWAVVHGKALSYRGWELTNVKEWIDPRGVYYPSFRHKETGEIIPEGYNLSALCRKYGLNTGTMSLVKNGKRIRHKGWEVLT